MHLSINNQLLLYREVWHDIDTEPAQKFIPRGENALVCFLKIQVDGFVPNCFTVSENPVDIKSG